MQKILATVQIVVIAALGFLQYEVTHTPQSLGATIPTVAALFESSLASKVTSSATTMTLVSGVDKQSVALSGTYGFIIDEGSSNQEFVLCTATGTALSACTRGISVTDGKTGVSALQSEHRRGASVKVTDYPQLAIISRMLDGRESVPHLLTYTSGTACDGTASNSAICDKAYIDGVAVAGASNANTTTKGIVEQATLAEANAGTATGGTGAVLFIDPATLLSSQYFLQLPSVAEKAGLFGTKASASSSNKFTTKNAFLTFNGWLTSNASASGDLIVRTATGLTRIASAGGAVADFALLASDSQSGDMAWEPIVRWQYISHVTSGSGAVIPTGAKAVIADLAFGSDAASPIYEFTLLKTGKTTGQIATYAGAGTRCSIVATWGATKITYTTSGSGCLPSGGGPAAATSDYYFYK